MSSPEKTRTVVILTIDKYAITQDELNYTVARLKDRKGTIDHNTNSYHSSLKYALQNLSERLLKDKLNEAAKDRALQLNELRDLIEKHVAEFQELTKGH